MKIKLVKFGEILTSREAGREAALAIKAYQKPFRDESIELDFDGVLAVGPSWLGEVLKSLNAEYGKARVICLPSNNRSVIESLNILNAEES
jgi:hypothetical protein